MEVMYRNMDVEKLAKKCKVEPELIGKWENNDIMPSAQELYVISKALDVDMNYFFEEIGESDDWYAGNEWHNYRNYPQKKIMIWHAKESHRCYSTSNENQMIQLYI